jgi:hypothetical protein
MMHPPATALHVVMKFQVRETSAQGKQAAGGPEKWGRRPDRSMHRRSAPSPGNVYLTIPANMAATFLLPSTLK